MDKLTPEQRRRNMQSIRARDTKPEVVLRKLLWHEGIRYRKNWKALPGTPDIALTRYKIAIFIDGEFWHGKAYYSGYEGRKYHSLKEQLEHGNNTEFWKHKIERNMRHDLEVEADLNGLGWRVIRFWSKDVIKQPKECLNVIQELLFEQHIGNDSVITNDSPSWL